MAVLGTGIMGSSMARRLASKGFRVHLWNRTHERAERLAKEIGAAVHRTPWEAVESADVGVAFLADDNAVLSTVSTFRRADGLVFVNSSTITPRTSEMVANYLHNLGVCYVEAPVVGGSGDILEGRALFMVAGDDSCLRVSEPVLRTAGDYIVVSDRVGTAMALKLAYNLLLITTVASLSEAVALSESYGVDSSRLLEVLRRTAFASVGEKYLPRILNPSSPVHFRLSLAAKDLEYASRAAFDAGLAVHVADAAARLYKHADAHGLGDLDYTRVIDFLRPRRAS